jgi:hypothetical protein
MGRNSAGKTLGQAACAAARVSRQCTLFSDGETMSGLTLRCGATLALVVAFSSTTGAAQLVPQGTYVCTVEQKAGIGAEMQEGAAPPAAFIDKTVTKLRIVVTAPTKRAKGHVRELTRTGAKPAVLLSPYAGDGFRFTPAKEQAFLHLDFIGEAGWLWFYHAGFEKPDLDHLNLSVRSGPCEPVK